jgi:hypothetical protein
MFGDMIDFESFCTEDKIVEFLYSIFKKDFINERCLLCNQIYIDPKSSEKREGKEEIFWHIVTRKHRSERRLDKPRASRIKWIKPIILNHNHEKIKMFYFFEDTGKIRLYLWGFEIDFVVILQKLGASSSYLVTSFYIDNQKKRDGFEKKFQNYGDGTDHRLRGCEWF